jgi:hypothetical protein
MRRTDREIKDRRDIDDIIGRCRVCRLGLCDEGRPYIVPLSFGYDGSALYFHAAGEGRKIDILKKNNQVCFELDILHDIVSGDQICRWGMAYESVIGFGAAEVLHDLESKRRALACIVRRYGSEETDFPGPMLAGTTVIRVRIEEVSGKARR